MLQQATTNYTKILLISALAVSFTACTTGTETATTPENSASSPITSVATSSPQTTSSPANLAPLGVNDINEVNFKPVSKNAPGFFDAVNGSSATKIEVSKANPINVSGWAILTNKGKAADAVIITHGSNNSLVAVAPVNLARQDVVKQLKNPAFGNAGWSTTFNASALPAGEGVLKGWVYNSTTKEATQLEPTYQITVTE
jgi:hypothetical protein